MFGLTKVVNNFRDFFKHWTLYTVPKIYLLHCAMLNKIIVLVPFVTAYYVSMSRSH